MKTRLLFATMVLPALFAACTNDEIVDSQSPSLDGRALLDPNFTITVNGEADTRFSWTEDGYKWNDFTANDKFSAGLLIENENALAAKPLTNYVFSTKDGNGYTTTSQMMEGFYMFYSYPGFEKNAKSEPVPFDLTSQVSTDLTKPADVVNAEKGQLFIAPLYQLEAETANNKLGLQFISYWSTAVIPVANVSNKSFKIARIVLRSKDVDFLVKGTIDPQKMNKVGLIYKYDKDKGTYVLGKNDKEDAVYDDLRVADIAAGGGQEVKELVVNCGSYELAAGKSVTAYIQVPAKAYAEGMEVEVVAEVTEVVAGKNVTSLKSLVKKAEPNYKSDDKLAANDQIRFRRSKSTGIFGIAADNTPNAYEVDDLELTVAKEAKGLYASTYDEVYKYVTEAAADESTANSPISIYNQGSLTVDYNMMSLISRVKTKHIKFLNPIEISSEGAADLINMQFAGGATIVKGAINFGAGVRLDEGKELTIKEGATAKFGATAASRADYSAAIVGKIINNGTLQLGGAAIAAVKNGKDAVVEIVGNQTIGGTLADGVVTTFNAPKTLKVAKDATLIIGAAMTIGYGQMVEVAKGGTITATAALTNNGTIDNYGTISAVTNTNAAAEGKVQKIAVINNYGTITTATVSTDATNGSALIVMKAGDAVITDTGNGAGEIDNTVSSIITGNNGKAVVYAKYSGDKTGKLGSVMQCTKVIMENGTWTEPKLPATGVNTLELNGVKLTNGITRGTITFGGATSSDSELTTVKMKNSSSVDALTFAATVTTADLTGSTFAGNVTYAGATGLTLDYATFNGALTLGAATALNLRGVVVNGAVTATTVTAVTIQAAEDYAAGDSNTITEINGEVSIKPAGAESGDASTLTIEAGARMNVGTEGSIGSAGAANGTTVENEGYVENKGVVTGSGDTPSGGTWTANPYIKKLLMVDSRM